MADEYPKLDRRALLQIFPVAFLSNTVANAALDHCGSPESSAQSAGPYRFQFFSDEEAALFDSVAEHIIPSDEHSPGAREAKVPEFADLMISTGPDYVKEDWHNGLRLLASELKDSELKTWLERVSKNEGDPRTVLEIFFRTMKEMTVNGYYTSTVGIHQDLRYEGNTYLTAFPGCEHSEHKG